MRIAETRLERERWMRCHKSRRDRGERRGRSDCGELETCHHLLVDAVDGRERWSPASLFSSAAPPDPSHRLMKHMHLILQHTLILQHILIYTTTSKAASDSV